jgi:hypothetical protein
MSSQEPEIVVAGRPQLFHLLAEAAEVEHTLMCTYLYAAFSLKGESDEGLSADEMAAVKRWRKSILSVALDEMVHLLLVANLSIAIGGRPHFARPNFPVSPGHFPAEVVVRLAPFDDATLDHFIFLERPRGLDIPDGEGFEPSRPYEREEAYEGLMPSVQDYATIGHLYDALRTNLASAAKHLGERRLFLGPLAGQVGPETVQLEGVSRIASLTDALRAVDLIVEQGEGSPSDRSDSHYQSFLAIRKELRQLRARNPAFVPGRPAATSPVMRRPPEPEGKVFVDAPVAARVLDFGNAIYATLLQLLVQAFHRTGADVTAGQRALFDAAVELMHLVSRIGSALTRLPASGAVADTTAGLSFTMLRGVEPFTPDAERALLAERLRELGGGAGMALRGVAGLEGVGATLEQLAAGFD